MSSRMAAVARGLDVRVNNQMMIDAEFRLHQEKANKENQQKKEAWLLGNDIKFGKALDPYNKGRLNEFSGKTMDKISSLMQDQSIMSNPTKLAELQTLKNSLIDNEIIDESIQYQTQKDMMNQYMNDPRNQEFLDEPEIEAAMRQVEMYEATGSIDGSSIDRKKFTFRAPPTRINTADIIAGSFGQLQARGSASWGAGVDGYRQFVTKQDMRSAASNLYNDKSIQGKAMRREWNELEEDKKAMYANDPINWIVSRGKGYASKDVFKPGTLFKPNSGRGGSGGSGGIRDYYRDTVSGPLLNAMRSGVANPEVQNSSLVGTMVGPDKRVNAQQARVYDAGGNPVMIDFGLASNARETGVARLRTVNGDQGLAPDGQLGMEMEVVVPMTVEQLRAYESELFDVLDLSIFQQLLPGADFDEANDFDIEPQFESVITKSGKVGEDGSHLLDVHMWLPMSSDIPEIVNNVHGKKQNAAVNNGPQMGQEIVGESGATFVLTETGWKIKS